MSIYKIFPNLDATIYSAYPTQNTGLDEILEVSVKNSEKPTTSDDIRRSIVQFANSDINKLWTISGTGSYNYDTYLRLYLANAENLSSEYTLQFNQCDVTWVMGTGKFADDPITTNGVCWYTTSSYSSSLTNNWPNSSYYNTAGGGSWNLATVSQSFTYKDNKDINVSVKSYFNNWKNSNSSNHGILIKHTSSVENNSNSYKVLSFFSGDTHTIFPPCLEIRWDDSSYNTGSLKVIDNTNTILNLANNPYTIKSTTDKYRFRVTARDKYPVRTFSTSSIYLVNKALPQTSYWGLQDVKTEDMIIDFDDNYTKISCNSSGSYFDLYISGLEPERYYKVLTKIVLNSGETQTFDSNMIFKVVR
jgi:hypothetical protein